MIWQILQIGLYLSSHGLAAKKISGSVWHSETKSTWTSPLDSTWIWTQALTENGAHLHRNWKRTLKLTSLSPRTSRTTCIPEACKISTIFSAHYIIEQRVPPASVMPKLLTLKFSESTVSRIVVHWYELYVSRDIYNVDYWPCFVHNGSTGKNEVQ